MIKDEEFFPNICENAKETHHLGRNHSKNVSGGAGGGGALKAAPRYRGHGYQICHATSPRRRLTRSSAGERICVAAAARKTRAFSTSGRAATFRPLGPPSAAITSQRRDKRDIGGEASVNAGLLIHL